MDEFVTTDTGEPHAQRRRALLKSHPEIRALFGYDRRTAWVTGAVVIAQLAIAGVFEWQARREGPLSHAWVLWPAAYVLGGTLTHWLSMSIHETSHNAAARTAWGNRAIALFANLPMVVPVAMTFHRYHLDHHRELGVRDGDTDLPLEWEVRWIGRSRWRKALWLVLHPVVYAVRGLTFAKPFNRREWGNIVLMVVANAAIVTLLGPTALLYLALSFFFAHSLHPAAAHFVHEHYTFAPGQETFSYYGPLNWVTFNVGYHNEHHDFMNIPGWRLPALRTMVPDYDRLTSHRSWVAILVRFIFDRDLGYGSRIVRTREAYLAGRAPRQEVHHAAG